MVETAALSFLSYAALSFTKKSIGARRDGTPKRERVLLRLIARADFASRSDNAALRIPPRAQNLPS